MSTIKRIDVYPLAYKEPHYRGAERSVTLVRIETPDGVAGWGEAISQFREASLATKILITDGFAPLLKGQDARDIERHWQTMCRHAYWYGVEGIAAFAISAIDMALWDLKGKLLGKPAVQLLGQPAQQSILAMASIIFDMDSLDWTLNEFRSFKEEGYRVVKAGWGMRPDAVFGQDRARDLLYVREVRRVIGDDLSLVVDVPGARGLWDVTTAIERLREWEPFNLRWVEQPLHPADLAAHTKLRASTKTPIGTGEDEWSPETYKAVIESNGVDVVQIDPGRCLGLTGCREVVRMVEAAGLKCSAHSWSGALNTAASLCFLALSRCGDACDFKPHATPMQHELVEDPWVQKEGLISLRATPGLGVNVRQSVVDQYCFG